MQYGVQSTVFSIGRQTWQKQVAIRTCRILLAIMTADTSSLFPTVRTTPYELRSECTVHITHSVDLRGNFDPMDLLRTVRSDITAASITPVSGIWTLHRILQLLHMGKSRNLPFQMGAEIQ